MGHHLSSHKASQRPCLDFSIPYCFLLYFGCLEVFFTCFLVLGYILCSNVAREEMLLHSIGDGRGTKKPGDKQEKARTIRLELRIGVFMEQHPHFVPIEYILIRVLKPILHVHNCSLK